MVGVGLSIDSMVTKYRTSIAAAILQALIDFGIAHDGSAAASRTCLIYKDLVSRTFAAKCFLLEQVVRKGRSRSNQVSWKIARRSCREYL